MLVCTLYFFFPCPWQTSLINIDLDASEHRPATGSSPGQQSTTATEPWLPLLFVPYKSPFMASVGNKATGIFSAGFSLPSITVKTRT